MAGEAPTGLTLQPDELWQELEVELLSRWQTGDEFAIALRADASLLLQAVGGVEAAMAAATAGRSRRSASSSSPSHRSRTW